MTDRSDATSNSVLRKSRIGSLCTFIHGNLANAVSIIGVLPLCLLFREGGDQFLIPLIVYNNIMDDLDGVLAAKLNIRSGFGAILDNVCDSIAHSIFVMVIGMHFGGVCAAASLIGVAAMVLRGVSRLDPERTTGAGSPTNELIRHIFFILVLAGIFEFNASPYLTAAFLLHALSMLLPYKLPYLLRGMTKSALAIGLVNVSLIIAWGVPVFAPAIAACFFGSYFLSLAIALIQRCNVISAASSPNAPPSQASPKSLS